MDGGRVFWAHVEKDGEEVMVEQEIFEELDAYVVAYIKPLSRHLIRGKSDNKRQANALERIATSIDRIEDTGLKTRDY